MAIWGGCPSWDGRKLLIRLTMETNIRTTNRLINEKSPYLLQHAHNPVNWYPWGEEAFQRAKREDKPIFLSIGYSTCHWCHVMARESFNDPEVARLLNEGFISIKVDREERPDIDGVYMKACQAMTGSGGWPLTVVMTPEGKPFFATTYIPKENRFGRTGMKELIPRIIELWRSQREELLNSAEGIVDALLNQALPSSGEGGLDEEVLHTAYRVFSHSFDERYGGFGRPPKFPSPHNLSFLLSYWRRTGEGKGLEMAERTLTEMAGGGMYDHIGGGFHRYSTDAQWHIPHFEKMLYDQALLAKAYLQLYQVTHQGGYAQMAREIFSYLLRDMRDPQGGFYSAEDADSPIDAQGLGEKREGAFYLWEKGEILDSLGKERGEVFCYRFGIKEEGNMLPDPQGEFQGKNILHIAHSIEDTAAHFKLTAASVQALIDESKGRLLQVRSLRPRPGLDDKVLTDWNGLIISSLAYGYLVLGEQFYRDAAAKAARFILKNMWDAKGGLLHRYRDGEAAVPGMIDDYAFLIHGLIDLYQATFQIEYLRQADSLAQEMLDLFWDEGGGGFFFTPHGGEAPLFRRKEGYDGAIPSGNSIAALDLVRLSKLTSNREYEERAEELLGSFAAEVSSLPHLHSQMLIALGFALGTFWEISLAEGADEGSLEPMLKAIYERFIPNKVVVFRPRSEERLKEALKAIPFLKDQIPLEDKLTAYVCQGYACRRPVDDIQGLEEVLSEQQPTKKP